MIIGILQASSQKDKNQIIEACLREALPSSHTIVNFGVFEEGNEELSYLHVSILIALLLESKAVDFIFTGCSSGQGMMLACNSFAGVICGLVQNVSDAYLFGRINNGNVVSYPLGLHWGWSAEINLKETCIALFKEPFGKGYPEKDADRKRRDTNALKELHEISKKHIIEVLPLLDEQLMNKVMNYTVVYDYIMKYGKHEELKTYLRNYRK